MARKRKYRCKACGYETEVVLTREICNFGK